MDIGLFICYAGFVITIDNQFVLNIHLGAQAQGDEFAGEIIHFRLAESLVFETAMEEKMTKGLVLITNCSSIHEVMFPEKTQLLCHPVLHLVISCYCLLHIVVPHDAPPHIGAAGYEAGGSLPADALPGPGDGKGLRSLRN